DRRCRRAEDEPAFVVLPLVGLARAAAENRAVEAHHMPGAVEAPEAVELRRVAQNLGSKRADARVAREYVQRARSEVLGKEGVAIEQHDDVAAALAQRGVVAAGKAKVARQVEQLDLGIAVQQVWSPGGAGIVDEQHLAQA